MTNKQLEQVMQRLRGDRKDGYPIEVTMLMAADEIERLNKKCDALAYLLYGPNTYRPLNPLEEEIGRLREFIEKRCIGSGQGADAERWRMIEQWRKQPSSEPGCVLPPEKRYCTCYFMGKDDVRPDHSPNCMLNDGKKLAALKATDSRPINIAWKGDDAL